jgi:integrase
VARRKGSGVLDLPAGIHVVRSRGRDYYYFSPHRGTAYAGQRIPLGTEPTSPEFWSALKTAQGDKATGVRSGSFAALIAAYKNSSEWLNHAPNTRENYGISLRRIEKVWGDLTVSGLTAIGIYKLRDQFAETPVAANHLVSVLRTIIAWGIPRGHAERNPALDVVAINILDEQSARPWPEEAYRIVREEAPEHLRRAAFLGRVTGQRRSDLVRMGRRNRRDDGLDIQIKKLRGKAHFIPLNRTELEEIDSWSCSDTGPWIVSPRGRPMSADHLAASLGRFVASRAEMKDIPQLTPHGWRAMAVCDRRLLGLTHQEIAAQIGMSLQMVIRYSRHIDQEELARRGNAKREQTVNEIVKSGGTGL